MAGHTSITPCSSPSRFSHQPIVRQKDGAEVSFELSPKLFSFLTAPTSPVIRDSRTNVNRPVARVVTWNFLDRGWGFDGRLG